MILLFLAGCSNLTVNSIDHKKLLNNRLDSYIKAKNSNDFEAEYSFFSPTVREKLPFDRFIKKRV